LQDWILAVHMDMKKEEEVLKSRMLGDDAVDEEGDENKDDFEGANLFYADPLMEFFEYRNSIANLLFVI